MENANTQDEFKQARENAAQFLGTCRRTGVVLFGAIDFAARMVRRGDRGRVSVFAEIARLNGGPMESLLENI